jgi:hypothetical protein
MSENEKQGEPVMKAFSLDDLEAVGMLLRWIIYPEVAFKRDRLEMANLVIEGAEKNARKVCELLGLPTTFEQGIQEALR